MITKATISLNDKVKKAGQQNAKENAIRGGFSAYIENLIQDDLDKDNPMVFKERTFTEREISSLQSEVHAITGNGKVMQCFNALLGVCAGS